MNPLSTYFYLKLALIVALIAVCGLTCTVLWHLDDKVQALQVQPYNQLPADVGTSARSLSTTLDQLKTLLGNLDQKLNGPDGTLPRFNGTVSRANALLTNADVKLNGTGVAKPQDFAVLPALTQGIRDVRQTVVDANGEQKQYYTDLRTDTAEVRTSLLGPDGAITRLNTGLTTLDSALEHLDEVTAHAAMISDPATPGTVAANLTRVSSDAASAADDVKVGFHKWLHPSKAQVVLGVVQRFGLAMISAHTIF